jgi:hypothetical protein
VTFKTLCLLLTWLFQLLEYPLPLTYLLISRYIWLSTPWQETHLAQTHFRKTETTTNHSHQNILVTRTQVKLSTNNKLLLYKAILKQIWTYGIQLWSTASTFNIEMLERFQSKTLLMIVDAPWYVPNTVTRRDLQIPTVKEEIQLHSSQYSARLSVHPDDLLELPDNRRLRRHLSNDLPTRFLVWLLYS